MTKQIAKEGAEKVVKETGEKGAKEGSGKIYKVAGESTSSGKPYVGRTKQSSPGKRGQGANDGRDRTNAEVIDDYDPAKPGEGAYKEQKAMDLPHPQS